MQTLLSVHALQAKHLSKMLTPSNNVSIKLLCTIAPTRN